MLEDILQPRKFNNDVEIYTSKIESMLTEPDSSDSGSLTTFKLLRKLLFLITSVARSVFNSTTAYAENTAHATNTSFLSMNR